MIKFKKLDYIVKDKEGNETTMASQGVLPTRAHTTDAGLDLTATRLTQEVDPSGKLTLVYHTDIAVEIPEGYVGLLFMRSSVANRSITLVNAVGVIDSGYRGEIISKFKITTDAIPSVYQPGEKFAQLVIVPISLDVTKFVDELSESDRDADGFGSTDNKDTVESEVSNNEIKE